jgi:hypothetical protein
MGHRHSSDMHTFQSKRSAPNFSCAPGRKQVAPSNREVRQHIFVMHIHMA